MEFSVLGSFIALLLVNPLVLARTYDFWPCFFGVGGQLEPARVRARPRPAWAQPSLGPAQRPGTIFFTKSSSFIIGVAMAPFLDSSSKTPEGVLLKHWIGEGHSGKSNNRKSN